MKKRGVSPVIAVILLIALVVVIGVIIFFWFKSMTQEAVVKFENENVKVVCERVSFDADYDGNGFLTISNVGNVPIYDFEVILKKAGSHSTKTLKEIFSQDTWIGLNQGSVFSEDISGELDSVEKITLIPVLMGLNKDGEKKTASCEERHGMEISV